MLARRGASSGYAFNYRRALAADHKHYAKLGQLLRLGAVPWDQGGQGLGTHANYALGLVPSRPPFVCPWLFNALARGLGGAMWVAGAAVPV